MKPFIMRVALLAGGLSIVLFFVFNQIILVPIGIFLGAFISLQKIRVYKNLLIMKEPEEGKSRLAVLGVILCTILPFLALIAAVMVDQWLFMGVVIGLLLSVFVIMINIITEKIGLTHNEWAEWF